ncbi:MAG: zinc-ribbon domain-containing protein [Candidatus Caldarchaeum sp.]|nr:zinc-ribbon domain-containing protein [Candidatus Caldarchaeum sp.]MDW8435413.1 hypothetical protein [Candidatus Caldarchaeum sp.]
MSHVYQCPNCGAPSQVKEGDVAVRCRYCSFTFRTFEEESRYIVSVYFDSSRAIENFLLWVKKQTGYEESLPLNLTLKDVKLHFYPFWVSSVKARTAFSGVGEDAEYSQPEGRGFRNIRTVLKQESGSFDRFFEVALPASKEIAVPGQIAAVSRARKFFSHEYVERYGGILHGATVTREEARQTAEQIARGELSRLIMQEVVQVNSRNDEIVVGEISLVYIPVWNVVYEFKGKKYQAFIDASSSRVISATYPPDIVEKTAYMAVSAVHALAGFASAGLLWTFGWLPAATSLTGFIAAAVVYAWRGLSPTKAAETYSSGDELTKQLADIARKTFPAK